MVADDGPAVIRAYRNDHVLAAKGIPPDAEQVDRGYFQHGGHLGLERASARFGGHGAPVGTHTVIAHRHRALLGGGVFDAGIASTAALQKARDSSDLIP